MAYATASNVQVILTTGRFTIGASSEPSTTTVGEWLDQLSAQVDAALKAAGYGTVPATGTTDLLLLKAKVAEACARLVVDTAKTGDLRTISDLEAFNAFLTQIVNWEWKLVDQSPSKPIGVMQAKIYGT